MKQKLNCILLIDDDKPTNFINEVVIKQLDCAEKIVVVQNGSQALDYLKSKDDGEHPQPDLIFLDINMPAMNGWEFLEKYTELDKKQHGKVVVIMLTTSLNKDDEMKASGIPYINGFKSKPLTPEIMQEVLEEYFADWL